MKLIDAAEIKNSKLRAEISTALAALMIVVAYRTDEAEVVKIKNGGHNGTDEVFVAFHDGYYVVEEADGNSTRPAYRRACLRRAAMRDHVRNIRAKWTF